MDILYIKLSTSYSLFQLGIIFFTKGLFIHYFMCMSLSVFMCTKFMLVSLEESIELLGTRVTNVCEGII